MSAIHHDEKDYLIVSNIINNIIKNNRKTKEILEKLEAISFDSKNSITISNKKKAITMTKNYHGKIEPLLLTELTKFFDKKEIYN